MVSPPPLRALTLGELLDVGFGLYRSRFVPLLIVAIVVHVLPTVVGVYLQTAEQAFALWPVMLAYLLVEVILSSLGVAATTNVISETYLGREITAGEALRRAVPLLWRLIVISVLTWLLVGIGLILLFVPGFILLSGLLLSSVVMVVERPAHATAAMARSWELTKGDRGKAFGTLVVAFLLLVVPIAAVGGVWQAATPASEWNSPVPDVVTAVLQVLVYPYVYSVTTLLYYDMRIRKEGFDLELLAAAAGEPA
ncbi:MAG: hypothetical protein ACT4PM_10895 [Gemmatimonadales bacterium]